MQKDKIIHRTHDHLNLFTIFQVMDDKIKCVRANHLLHAEPVL